MAQQMAAWQWHVADASMYLRVRGHESSDRDTAHYYRRLLQSIEVILAQSHADRPCADVQQALQTAQQHPNAVLAFLRSDAYTQLEQQSRTTAMATASIMSVRPTQHGTEADGLLSAVYLTPLHSTCAMCHGVLHPFTTRDVWVVSLSGALVRCVTCACILHPHQRCTLQVQHVSTLTVAAGQEKGTAGRPKVGNASSLLHCLQGSSAT